MSSVPEYTKRAIKRYQVANRDLIKLKKRIYYLQHAEELKRKRRERYHNEKLAAAVAVN